MEAAITAATSLLATAAELAKVPKVGQTHRFTQLANNSGAKTADVSISVIPTTAINNVFGKRLPVRCSSGSRRVRKRPRMGGYRRHGQSGIRMDRETQGASWKPNSGLVIFNVQRKTS